MDKALVLSPAPPSVWRALKLSVEEGFILSRVERSSSVAEIIAASGFPELRALRGIQGLVEKGALVEPPPWGDFPFDRVELEEDVELTEEQRKNILFRFHTLDRTSHYRLLGVAIDAPFSDVRTAYLKLSKTFHPDVYFRKRLGSYEPKVRAIFQRLTLAWETLSDDSARLAYEREGKGFTTAERMQFAKRALERLEDEKRTRSRREFLLRAKGFARLTKAREELAEGNRFLAAGEIHLATTRYELALALDPKLEEARVKMREAERVALLRRADLALDIALAAEARGDLRRALKYLRDGAGFDGANARIQLSLARVVLRDNPKAATRALEHMARALELGAPVADTHLLHGEILLALGEKKLARQELAQVERADERDRARVLLKSC